MTHSDHSTTPVPVGRTDSTRPRRGGDRGPYPSAPAGRAASRRPTRGASTPTRSRTASTAPTPATVWACGPTPIDPDAPWPTPLLTTIVTSFSEPGDRVVVLPWPTAPPRPPHSPVGADGLIDHIRAAEPDDELATALAAITDLARRTRVVRVEPDPTAHAPASPPFWADLVGTPDNTHAPESDSPPSPAPDAAANRLDVAAADADLIITSLRPEHSADHTSDHIARLAARLLRVGGILAVLTHSDWEGGELIDPTGPMVAAAQNADLLYLQHIVALHTPIHGGQFLSHLPPTTATTQAPTRHHTHGRGRRPAPHRRISSDLLVFAQPHDHQPPPLTSAAAVVGTGVLR